MVYPCVQVFNVCVEIGRPMHFFRVENSAVRNAALSQYTYRRMANKHFVALNMYWHRCTAYTYIHAYAYAYKHTYAYAFT